ncbi:Indole-3-glycerol phosphate synthase [compost metagenome]
MPSLDLIGVNNRNLNNFETSLTNSFELAASIPNDFVKISESGINTPEDIQKLKKYGFEGFLVGESFMKTNNPGLALEKFIKEINSKL